MAFRINDYNSFLTSLYDKQNNNGSPDIQDPNRVPQSPFPVDFDFGLKDQNHNQNQQQNQNQNQNQNRPIKSSDLSYSTSESPIYLDSSLDRFDYNEIRSKLGPVPEEVRSMNSRPGFDQYVPPSFNDRMFKMEDDGLSLPTSPLSSYKDDDFTALSKVKSEQCDPPHDLRLRKVNTGSSLTSSSTVRPRVKSAHNVIEQRYRNKINDKFTALQDSVPTLRVAARKKSKTHPHEDDDEEILYDMSPNSEDELVDLEGLEPARKLNKGTILAKSIEYIKFLELKNDRMRQEHEALVMKARMLGLDISQISDI